jgi:ribosomal protein S12 methylthiotransferase
MKIGLISLGCPKNLVDSEVMLGLAQDAGHELTNDPATADVLIVNTCAFIDAAKQESIDAILEMAEVKRKAAGRRLIVTGCLAERYRDELKAEIPEIDDVLGTGEVPDIVRAIGGSTAVPLMFYKSGSSTGSRRAESGTSTRNPISAEAFALNSPSSETLALSLSSLDYARDDSEPVERSRGEPRERPTYIYDEDTPRLLATPKHYAYVKIAEGCDYKCAFCIIPTLRGAYRSRPADSIVREARRLAERGVKELLLISQDTTFYGIDRSERGALARLLRELNRIDGLEWIRLLYLYPTTIDDDTLAAMAECEKVCKYIDLPLQHASNEVLKRMKRPGTRQKYDTLLDKIRTRVPGVALRTTFIVGFPGETEADVEELSGFVSCHAFDHVGVFTYSHEEGTSAFTLSDDVPRRVKAARRTRVMGLQKRLVSKRNRGRIGERVRILVDGPASEHELVLKGRLETQAPDIDASVFLTDCDPSRFKAGELADVEIVGAKDYDLIARPLVSG